MDVDVRTKYERLGFTRRLLGMELTIGTTQVTALEHPLDGVALTFSCIGGRSASYFESSAPSCASVEQIGALIYSNLAKNIPGDTGACRRKFSDLGIFQ